MDVATRKPQGKTGSASWTGLLACTVLMAALSGHSAAVLAADGEATLESRFKEGWLEGKIETVYLLNPHLNNFDIDVAVQGTNAIISGTVKESIDRELAGAIAEGIEGIDNVDNRIEVSPDAGAKGDGASQGMDLAQRIKDATITTKVKAQLIESDNIAGLAVDVDTRKGVVTLNGEVDSAAASDLAGRLAGNVDGVVDVDNRLAVKDKAKDNNK